MFRRKFTVFEYERGLLYRHGKLDAVLDGGRHVRWGGGWSMVTVDMRSRVEMIGTQEILTQDGLAVKLTASAEYHVVDPKLAVHATEAYQRSAYLAVQLALRDAVTGLTAEELLQRRNQIGETATSACAAPYEQIGLKVDRVELRDISFPGELKRVFAQVALAQKEAQAALERARGEMASLRSLANAAKMLENNPALLQLRVLQSISEAKGATIVIGGDGRVSLP